MYIVVFFFYIVAFIGYLRTYMYILQLRVFPLFGLDAKVSFIRQGRRLGTPSYWLYRISLVGDFDYAKYRNRISPTIYLTLTFN